MRKSIVGLIVFISAMFVWMGLNVFAANWSNPVFETPMAPLIEAQSQTYADFDVQIHNRDHFNVLDATMDAQHGAACQGPPATHPVSLLSEEVFICNGHVMTAAWGQGYALIGLTPRTLIDCSSGCVVQWDMSTERQSLRDWPDMWLTPWNDNLTLPFDEGDVDLQGIPRRGIHVNLQNGPNNSFHASTIANYVQTDLPNDSSVGISQGITAGTNQAAIRQTFKLTVTSGHIRFERLASATATAVVWVDTSCSCLLANDYVVQFAQHSYNPTKDFAGVPATWHWFGNPSGLMLNNVTPFTLIHSNLLPGNAVTVDNTLVTFDAPAPAQSWLRFSGVCQVNIQGIGSASGIQPKMTFLGHPEHASSYFVPIPAGTQSITVSFAPDAWYNQGTAPGCGAQDFAIWSKQGGTPPSPTPTPPPNPTSTPTVIPPTPIPSPTNTPTPVPPTPTFTPTVVPPTPTNTPTGPTRQCTLRWGNNTIESYGLLTQAECAARGQ